MNSVKIRLVLLILGLCLCAAGQQLFPTPDDALKALTAAAQSKDQAALTSIFGPDREKLLSGDPVQDTNALEHFAENLQKAAEIQRADDSKATLLIGEDKYPFPIPLVKQGDQWRFDTAAGMTEILNRRIGQNELAAIMTCRAYVVAQWEYFTQPLDTTEDGLAVYAQRFISQPGRRNGLYWDAPEGATPSPFGNLVEEARAEGYSMGQNRPAASAVKPASATTQPSRPRNPYHGYYFRILKAQGPHAPGGRFGYVINGHMIAGYALIAWPDKWGASGVMTFIVNQQGRVYQKNLGPKTAEVAAAIKEYDPDPTWTLVKEP